MAHARIVLPVYRQTKENISDLMTKPLTRAVLEYLWPRMLWLHEEPMSQNEHGACNRNVASPRAGAK